MSRTSTLWGTAIAIALGACASRPVMQPSQSPVFESNVRTDQLSDGPVEPGRPDVFLTPSRRGAEGAPRTETTATPSATDASPVPPLPGGSPQTQTEYAEICDSLRRDVHLQVQDIAGGARLVLQPSSGPALARVRRAAHDLERAVATTGTWNGTEPPCALFELAGRGASIRVREEGNSVLVEVTGKPKDRAAVRTGVRRYAETVPAS